MLIWLAHGPAARVVSSPAALPEAGYFPTADVMGSPRYYNPFRFRLAEWEAYMRLIAYDTDVCLLFRRDSRAKREDKARGSLPGFDRLTNAGARAGTSI